MLCGPQSGLKVQHLIPALFILWNICRLVSLPEDALCHFWSWSPNQQGNLPWWSLFKPCRFHPKPNFNQILGLEFVFIQDMLTPRSHHRGSALGLKGNTQAESWGSLVKAPPSPTPCPSYSSCLRILNTDPCRCCPGRSHLLGLQPEKWP